MPEQRNSTWYSLNTHTKTNLEKFVLYLLNNYLKCFNFAIPALVPQQCTTGKKRLLCADYSIFRRKWADLEVARNTAGQECVKVQHFRTLISQPDMCSHVLQAHADDTYIVQVNTIYY